MITSKQRAYLRGLANGIDALYQIGKEGITENMLTQFDNALEARELIKITILKNAFLDPRTTLSDLAEALEAEPVKNCPLPRIQKEQADHIAEEVGESFEKGRDFRRYL